MGSGAAATRQAGLWPPTDPILPTAGVRSILNPVKEMGEAMQGAWHHRMSLISLGFRVKMDAQRSVPWGVPL